MKCYKVAKISVQVALCEMTVHNVCVCSECECVFMHALYLVFRFACILFIAWEPNMIEQRDGHRQGRNRKMASFLTQKLVNSSHLCIS